MTLLLALSGGKDSSVLLHALATHTLSALPHAHTDLLPAKSPLIVAHFNHRIHAEADEHAAFAAQLATKYSLPFHLGTATSQLRSESEARGARYAFLEHTRTVTGATHIITAHHAGDQAETILFRLIRGSGITGLAGMPERTPTLLRPLLSVLPRDITSYAQQHSVEHIIDPTNASSLYARNILRNDVFPLLTTINSRAIPHITSIAPHLKDTDTALTALTASFLTTHTKNNTLPLSVLIPLTDSALTALLRTLIQRDAGTLTGIETPHLLEVIRIIRAPHGNKTKKCGLLTFHTTRQEGVRTLTWERS